MIIKVELYYEITRKPKGALQQDVKEIVWKMVLEEIPNTISGHDPNDPEGSLIEIHRVTKETMEKIRTGR